MSLGKIIKEIKPSENNGRNSEGAFYKFNDGKIIFIYSRYRSSEFADHAVCDLYKCESFDGGETFSDGTPVFKCEECKATNIMSVSLIKLKNGNAGLFFVKKIKDNFSTVLFSQSKDGNKWSKPERILFEKGYFVLNNDRFLRLTDGRLVFAVAKHDIYDLHTKNGRKKYFAPGTVYIYGSEDDKHFYRLSNGYNLNNSESGLQEPLLIQYKSGKVSCFARTDLRWHYCMTAKNTTLQTWSAPRKSVFSGPTSPLSMKRFDNTIFAIWNNYPPQEKREIWLKNGSYTYYRTSLVISYSLNDGKTFSTPKILEYNDERGFCYTAIHKEDDSLVLAYCSGTKEDKCCLNRITIRKIKINEILE